MAFLPHAGTATSQSGMSRVKGLARSYLWWPHMETDIEHEAKSRITCQEHRHRPAAPLRVVSGANFQGKKERKEAGDLWSI